MKHEITSDAIINGKMTTLTKDEMEQAANFHRNRVAFAIVNGKLWVNTNRHDERDHQHWLMEDFEMSIEEFEQCDRGYMIKDRIQLFRGSDFHPIEDPIGFMEKYAKSLLQFYSFKWKPDPIRGLINDPHFRVCNGVKVGKVGELWDPLEVYTLPDVFSLDDE